MSSFGFLLHVKVYERPRSSAKINKHSAADSHACALCYCLGYSGPSSEIRHQNQLTAKAWKKALQELGKFHMRMLSTKSFRIANILLLTSRRFPKKSVFFQGIVKIGDLLTNTGKFLQSSKALTANFPNPIF